jgi:hypothetical protein
MHENYTGSVLAGVLYMRFCIRLEITGAHPSSRYIIAFIQYADTTRTSLDKHIAPAKSVKETSSFSASDKTTSPAILHQTPCCSTQSKWKS